MLLLQRVKLAFIRRFKPFFREVEEFKIRASWIGFNATSEDNNHIVVSNQFYKEIWLRKNTSDISVFEQIFLHREYEPLIKVAKDNNFNINIIIDAGANIGLTSLRFLHEFPNAKVIAIEPDRENFESLVRNTKAFSDRIICLHNALWNNNDVLEISDDFSDGKSWSKSVRKAQNSSRGDIQGLTVSQLIETYSLEQIDIFKIDIEGSEAILFENEKSVGFLEKTRILALEIHGHLNIRDHIIRLLKNSNFLITQFRETTLGVNIKKIDLKLTIY